MGISIGDLNGGLQPVGASLLSGNETIMNNLRELSEEELRVCGGGKGKGKGGFGKGKGKGFAFPQQQPFAQPVNPQVVQPGGVPTTGIPLGGFPPGSIINITINVINDSSSTSNSGTPIDTRTTSY